VVYFCSGAYSYLQIFDFPPPYLVNSAKKAPKFGKSLNARKEVVPFDGVKEAVIVFDIVQFELDKQVRIVRCFAHCITSFASQFVL